MRFGVHARTAAGLAAAAAYAEQVGCDCVQIFAKGPMQWRAPALDPEGCAAFAAALEAAGIRPLFTHAAYLLNLSGPDDELRERSIAALADEMTRASLLRADGVVTHVGTAPDRDMRAAARRLAASLSRARSMSRVDVPVLLENSAGAGTLFCAGWDEFAAVFDALTEEAGAVGICLDVCHAHAAGIDLRDAAGWRSALDRADALVGLERLALIHANDCAGGFGAARDRHAWIGDGQVGEAGFAAMVREPRVADAPAICELAGEAPFKDEENLRRLRSLGASCAERAAGV